MKKALLFSLGLAAGLAVNAQSTNTPELTPKKVTKETPAADKGSSNGQISSATQRMVLANGVEMNLIGSSANIYSVVADYTTALNFNADINALLFTHRQDASNPGHNGIIQTSYSLDGGSNWENYLVTPEAYKGRYPSGVIYNPEGNTDASKAFAVVSGPIVDDTDGVDTTWIGNYFASIQLDGTNAFDTAVYNNDTFHQSFATVNKVATGDGRVHVISDSLLIAPEEETDPIIDKYTTYLSTGTFNDESKTFEYSHKAFRPNLYAQRDGGLYTGEARMAWSLDGTTGYLFQIGIAADADSAHRSYLPIIYKTTDSGDNWDLMPPMQWDGLDVLTERLRVTENVESPVPFFVSGNGLAGTVDKNGDLHLVSEVASQFYSPESQDSLSSYTASTPRYLYDFITDGTNWDAIIIDSLAVAPGASTRLRATGDAVSDSVTIYSRLQVSRNADASKIFYGYLKTDDYITEQGVNTNIFPDVFAKGLDIETGRQTNATNFTVGTETESDNFFLYMADLINQDDTTYHLPMTVSQTTGSRLQQVDHYYLSGIHFTDVHFVDPMVLSVESIEKNIEMAVYPNPAKNMLNIDINSIENGMMTIEVLNTVGQLVKVKSVNVITGANTINMDLDQLATGVYSVRATIGNKVSTSQVVVE